jgi:hypothetical protein
MKFGVEVSSKVGSHFQRSLGRRAEIDGVRPLRSPSESA